MMRGWPMKRTVGGILGIDYISTADKILLSLAYTWMRRLHRV